VFAPVFQMRKVPAAGSKRPTAPAFCAVNQAMPLFGSKVRVCGSCTDESGIM
jgi:hypothetical protein